MTQNRASWQDTVKFYKKIFSAIDEDVNGYLSDREFKKFLISCDIQVLHIYLPQDTALQLFSNQGMDPWTCYDPWGLFFHASYIKNVHFLPVLIIKAISLRLQMK